MRGEDVRARGVLLQAVRRHAKDAYGGGALMMRQSILAALTLGCGSLQPAVGHESEALASVNARIPLLTLNPVAVVIGAREPGLVASFGFGEPTADADKPASLRRLAEGGTAAIP